MRMAVERDIIHKSGAWFSYKDERIAQGRDNTKEYLREHPDVLAEIEDAVRAFLMKNSEKEKAESAAKPAPVEIPLSEAPRVTAAQAKTTIDIVLED